MGEGQKQGFQLSFNRFLRVGFQGWRVTSNGGLILVWELDERLGFSERIEEHLTDSRANNARFSFTDLLRQSVYIAYNLGNLWRRLLLPRRIEKGSLTSLQQRLVKTGGRLIKHARYYWLLLAEGHLTRRLFGAMVLRIAALPVPDE